MSELANTAKAMPVNWLRLAFIPLLSFYLHLRQQRCVIFHVYRPGTLRIALLQARAGDDVKHPSVSFTQLRRVISLEIQNPADITIWTSDSFEHDTSCSLKSHVLK